MKKILLVMDGGLAEKFHSIIESNSQTLEVLPQSVPLFRNLIPSLKHFKPDIVFILMSRVEFETSNHKAEVLKTIYQIKTDPELSNLRIAIQTKAGGNDPFLAKLASYQVYDIFSTHGDSFMDMGKLMRQLSEPANLKNVKDYLKIPFSDDSFETQSSDTLSPMKKELKKKKKQEALKEVKPKSDQQEIKPRKQVSNTNKITTNNQKRSSSVPAKQIHTNDTPTTEVSKPKQKLIKKKKATSFKQIKPLKKREEREALKPHKRRRKKWLIPLSVLCFLLILFVGIKALGNPVANTPSFDSLINQGEYAKAAQTYPSKAAEAENKMLQDSNVNDKAGTAASIMSYTDSDAVKFDNAYFNGQFNKVIDIYDDSSSPYLTNLNSERKTMLAYSYMKTGDIGDAKQTADGLGNDQLNEKIEAYQKFKEANKILEDKIKNGNLSPQDVKKAKHQIKQNKIAMKKL